MSKKAIIIGAGPAGLTAAYELLKRTDIKPIILEKSGDIGGISKTINYKGNRMDIGGHRFFSKSDRVMKWWMNIMPIQQTDDTYTTITYQRKHRTIQQEETHSRLNKDATNVMLIRKRLSRIYFLRKFFTYPIQLSIDTLKKLGLIRTIKILLSYLYAQIVPLKPEESLEDFMINRFGRQLYLLFFKDYTEKVWGVPCNEISAEWGAQRIKGISISKAIQHAAKSLVQKKNGSSDISQKGTETSLIEQFLYPALGPGQLWEEVAKQIVDMGGEIYFHQDVKKIGVADMNEEVPVFTEQTHLEDGSIFDSGPILKNHKQQTANHKLVHSVSTINSITGESSLYEGAYFFSTMPVQELIAGMNGEVPEDVKEIAAGLQYRDFITVGVLLERLASTDDKTGEIKTLDLKDTWIYIQEKDVKVGRLQLFNNWSPYMVNKPGTVWVGMEYFCNKGDLFWNLSNDEIQRTAIAELEKMGLAQVQDVLDSTVCRVEKTYPAYFGTYNEFDKIRTYVDQFENLFLVGRNGMHKYNNSDHSMLTAMVAVDNICDRVVTKENIWAINTEMEYHEEKASNSHNHPTDHQDLPINSSQNHVEQATFKEFLFHNPRNRTYLWCTAFAIFTQLLIFKILYPYAGFINGDSYHYILAASENFAISNYPIGYSKFLRLFSVFSRSDTALVIFQYLFIQAGALSFLFSIFYFYRPGKQLQVLLLTLIVLNPVFLYIANYVLSDSVFLALSLFWFTILLWILNQPMLKHIIWCTAVLFLAFTMRYNAMYYPIITAIAFFLTKKPLWFKFAGTLGGILIIGAFISYTSFKYYKLTGIKEFSPFSGWQLANNALYAYRYVDSADRKSVPKRFQQLNQIVTTYFDSSKDISKHPIEKLEASTAYMWDDNSPLRIFMSQHYKNSPISQYQAWASLGNFYEDYGKCLIRAYPLNFIKYYMWPNTIKYYSPPIEFLGVYNMGTDTIHEIARTWFEFKSKRVNNVFNNFKVSSLDFFPIFFGIINILFLCSFFCFLFLNGSQRWHQLRNVIFLGGILWIFNFGFSVFASSIALRFQIFPALIFLALSVIMLEYIFKVAFLSTNNTFAT